MKENRLFADVLFPLPVSGKFTYAVPEEFIPAISERKRVVVPFGKRKIYTGLVLRLHSEIPSLEVKNILSVLDEYPLVTEKQFEFWGWMAAYYLCHKGELMNAALPSVFKLAGESKIVLNPSADIKNEVFNEREQLLIESLHYRKAIPISEIQKILGLQKVIPVIKTLLDKGIILMEEAVAERYRPKTERFVNIVDEYRMDEDKLRLLFDVLGKRAKKQLDLLMWFYQLSGMENHSAKEMQRKELLAKSGASASILEALVKKGVLGYTDKIISRLESEQADSHPDDIILSEAQQAAYNQLTESLKTKDVVLLHGITSSGKTELYIRFIQEAIDRGEQVLYLLPEIALTDHLVNRLKKYFGNRIGVFHSRFHENERAEIWNRVLAGSKQETLSGNHYDIVLGARSALFLPFANLGLVVIDEEHDPSFKQFDPAPRYNARDAAIYLAHLQGAKTILGSATPSMESYFNAMEGKYGLVELNERYGKMELPLISVVDIRKEVLWKRMKSHFSSVLVKQLQDALSKKEQSILFQNRRGFSLRLECQTCNWIPMCRNCDVTLVYHKQQNQLRCHYCGYTTRIPEQCPECKGTNLKMKGFGTEKVEEELSILFPDARIARMDLDTTRTKHSLHHILADFDQRKIDILVGTQMVTKGLDFENVSTVSILNADNMLSFPDFRAAERSYQLMSQVSGRAGRKNKQGIVIIQTYNPDHPVIRYVVNQDFKSLYQQQLLDRRRFRYPPLYRLIMLKLRHKDPKILGRASEILAVSLKKSFPGRVLGPEYPMVARVMNYYIRQILLKLERNASMISMKMELVKVLEEFYKEKEYSSVRVIIDVDPQ